MTGAAAPGAAVPIALVAGRGRLPLILAESLDRAGRPYRVLALDGFAPEGLEAESFRLEKLGSVVKMLARSGVREVCFAGAVKRPKVDPKKIDLATMPLLPRVLSAARKGDDAVLRAIIDIFEGAGLHVVGAGEVLPSLLATPTAQPPAELASDAARAGEILSALSPLDLGQACVVAGGLCLGIETLQGTAALLSYIADTREAARAPTGGVLVKRAKAGQELRIDMPTIGPDTIDQAVAAGLAGIALQAGHVLVIDRPEVERRAAAAGLQLWAAP